MSFGVNMSFSMKGGTWKSRFLVIAFATAGFVAPVAYFAWWGLCGGQQHEIQRSIERLIQRDPASEAALAIRNQDYRLYTTGGPLDPQAPGVGWADESYRATFGYQGVTLFSGDHLSRDQARLNDAARRHMATYNQLVYAETNRAFPHWSEKYRQRERRSSGPS